MSENKKTNTANTANVLEFSQTYEQLLDLANKADDKNDKEKAIRLLQKASGEMLALFSDAGIDCYMLVYQHRI